MKKKRGTHNIPTASTELVDATAKIKYCELCLIQFTKEEKQKAIIGVWALSKEQAKAQKRNFPAYTFYQLCRICFDYFGKHDKQRSNAIEDSILDARRLGYSVARLYNGVWIYNTGTPEAVEAKIAWTERFFKDNKGQNPRFAPLQDGKVLSKAALLELEKEGPMCFQAPADPQQ